MARLRIEIVYALAHAQEVVALDLAAGAVAREALQASGMLGRHAELAAGRFRLGIYGKPIEPGQRLRNGDRIEILRPLAMDPKEARRRRARRR